MVKQIQVLSKGQKSEDCEPICKRLVDVFPVLASLQPLTKMLPHALPSHWRTGGIFRSKGTYRVLKHMTKNNCLTHFFEWGIVCIKPESALSRVG